MKELASIHSTLGTPQTVRWSYEPIILLIGDFEGLTGAQLHMKWLQRTETHNHLVHKRTLNHLAKLSNNWVVLWVLICTVNLTVCSYHVTYIFRCESILYSYLNVKELLARSRCKIWTLSDCNGIWTHNHLICKWRVNHLAKSAK